MQLPLPTVHTFSHEHGAPFGYLVIDTEVGERSCGGIRMASDLTLEELQDLARMMTMKFAFLGIQLGGAKAGIIGDAEGDPARKHELLKKLGEALKPWLKDSRYLPGLDLGISHNDLNVITNAAEMNTHRTKKFPDRSGEATALTVLAALTAACDHRGMPLRGARVALEGFGKVGHPLAQLLYDTGALVVAISTSRGSLVNEQGLNIPELIQLSLQQGSGFVRTYRHAAYDATTCLATFPADVYIPCARFYSVDETNVRNIQARVMCGGSNLQAKPSLENQLNERGILYVPPFIANCGGVLWGSMRNFGLSFDHYKAFVLERFSKTILSLLTESDSLQIAPLTLANELTFRRLVALQQQSEKKTSSQYIWKMGSAANRKGLVPTVIKRTIGKARLARAFESLSRDLEELSPPHNQTETDSLSPHPLSRSKPLKVLLVSLHLGGGSITRIIFNLLDYFNASAIEPVFVFYDSQHRRFLPADLRTYHLELPQTNSLSQVVYAPLRVWKIANIIRKEKPDIILSCLNRVNVIVALARLLSLVKTTFIISEQTNASAELSWRTEVRNSFPESLSYRRAQTRRIIEKVSDGVVKSLMRLLYPRADGIIAVSQGIKDDLVKNFGLSAETIDVIHNPVNIHEIQQRASEPISEQTWFDGSVPTIVAVGRMVPQKDYGTLLRAFKIVKEKVACRVVFIGEGELEQYLRTFAEELGVADDVAFLGYQENPFKFMRKSNVFVLSSLWEGFSCALSEALASGVPVVSTDCPSGPSELIQNGVTGLLVPVHDFEALAQAILRVLTDEQFAASLREQGPKSLYAFAPDVIARQYIALFEKVFAQQNDRKKEIVQIIRTL